MENLPVLLSVLSVRLGIFIWYLILATIRLEIVASVAIIQLIISFIGVFRSSENKTLISLGIFIGTLPVIFYVY